MASTLKSVRLEAELVRDLKKVAKQTRSTESQVIKQALRKYCAETLAPGKPAEGTIYDRVKHLLGGFRGPPDLGRNARKYVLEAIHAKAKRNRRAR